MPVERLLGNTDDTETFPEMTAALKAALPRYFEGWGEEALGEGLVQVWSGAYPPVEICCRLNMIRRHNGVYKRRLAQVS